MKSTDVVVLSKGASMIVCTMNLGKEYNFIIRDSIKFCNNQGRNVSETFEMVMPAHGFTRMSKSSISH